MLDDFGMVSRFAPLAVEDRVSMIGVVKLVDRACGWELGKASKSLGEKALDEVIMGVHEDVNVEDIWERLKSRGEQKNPRETERLKMNGK